MKLILFRKQLETYINNWLYSNDFDYKCQLGTNFSADLLNDKIYISLTSTELADIYFSEFMDKLGLDYDCDIFLLSFFHELGHFETLDIAEQHDFIAAEQIDDYLDKCTTITKKDYFKYFNGMLEKMASIWAVDYINTNPEKVKDFYDGLLPIIHKVCKWNLRYRKLWKK